MGKLRLLIADDSPEFRRNVRAMLAYEREFEIVAVARDGPEALEMARRLLPDVAVMDLHMPGMDGLMTIRAMAGVSPRTACLIMSVDGEGEKLRQAMAAGARAFLLKPFTTDEFVTAIRDAAAAGPEAAPRNEPRATGALHTNRPLNQAAVTLFLKTGRMDDEAAGAYAEYILHPQAEPEVMARLAEIFCARRDWRNLRLICERMERSDSAQP